MIILYHGKNTFLSRCKASEAITKRQSSLESKDINYEVRTFEGSSTPADDIIADIEIPSLFSTHKIIFIKRPSQSDDKDKLYECITTLLENSATAHPVDIILWEDSKLRANLRFVKALKKKDAIDESPELNKRTFRTWAKEATAKVDAGLTNDALFLLSERSNYDPERFTRELDKIKLLRKDTITEEDIENLCPDTLEHSIWEMLDALNDDNAALAERKLNLILRQGNDPQFVLLMLARNIRIILLTKLLLEQGASTYDIAKKIKVPPFTINSIREKARSISTDRISLIYDKLSNIDYSGKTGQLDISLALNILLSVI